MTSSDSGDSDPAQENPFDLDLPMLRTPVRQPSRGRQGRRGARRRPPPGRLEPLPIPGSTDRSGDWEEWLDQGARQPNPTPIEHPNRLLTREYDLRDDDNSQLVPQIIDRSGGNPGSRLRRARARRGDNRRGDKLLSVLILLGVAIVVVSVVLTVLHTGKHRHSAAASPPVPVRGSAPVAAPTAAPGSQSADPQTAAIATADCVQQRGADVVSGTDPGGTGTGPDAILAFERAYYVQRSGSAARAVVADDAQVPTAEQIQRGINKIPVGTRYCVQITRGSSDGSQWEVRLTQEMPGEPPHTFTQIIATRTIATRTLISAIASG